MAATSERYGRTARRSLPVSLLALVIVAALATGVARAFVFPPSSTRAYTPAAAAPRTPAATAPAATAPAAVTPVVTAPAAAPVASSASAAQTHAGTTAVAASQTANAATVPLPNTGATTLTTLPIGTTAGPTPGSFVVTVVHGETLSGIAFWFTTHGYAGIFRANEAELGSNPNYIVPGERIIVNPADESMSVVGAP